ncbi:MAG TPA: class I adenylate-forming enzyme family protein [Candidatus Binatia bacterium]|nr:class I adenylate-forming enzyme family protein [Candidatus Binatia bacterium]
MTQPQATSILANAFAGIRISDVVSVWAEHVPDAPAVVDPQGSWTYRDLKRVICETASWLRSSGVRPGDRVMIVGENCRVFAGVLLAVASLDAWPVPVNAHLAIREIEAVRDHSGARRILYTTSVSAHAAEHANRDGATIEEVPGLGQIALGPLNENTEPEPLESEIGSRVGALIYTSGSTGRPKGVMLTHRNLIFSAGGAAKIRSLGPADRLYGILPLSHIVGLSIVFLGVLLSGASIYLEPRFDPMTARRSLERERITVMLGVPSMFSQFLQYAKMRNLKTLKFGSLRIISCSGAPLPPAIKSSVESLFGLPLHHGYGITECSPNVAQVRLDVPPRKDDSVGPMFPGVEARLVGGDGQSLPEGEVGELWVRGPNIMKGYYRAPEETANAVNAEGWFNTRDLARFEDGNLFIVGRTKDLIIRYGFNVYPAEVEAVMNAHPAVSQSAVIGRAANGTEEIVAFVELCEGSHLSAADLAEYAGRHLAAYKRPTEFSFVSAMPMTASGKIAKNELAKRAIPVE